MSEVFSDAQDRLIARLSQQLVPVRTLPSAPRRAAIWLGATLWMAALLSLFADFSTLQHRLMATPDMGAAEAGAVLTAGLAALAAFYSTVPGRSAWWATLPLPPLLLWLGASTMGCLRTTPAASTVPEAAMHPMACLVFLLLVSLPLAMLLVFMLRRGLALRPWLTVLLGGLASAAAAATLLTMIHPFDATAIDLLVHLSAVCMIVGAMRVLGVPWLRART